MPAASRRLSLAVALASAVLAVPAAAQGAAFKPIIPRGGLRLPLGAHRIRRIARDSELHATVTLRPRSAAALAAYASGVTDPRSPDYHHYLSVARFAQRFAPAAAQIAAVRTELRAHGLVVGTTSPNRLSISVTGTAGDAEDAFATSIDRFRTRSGGVEELPTARPRLAGPGAIVQSVVGLDSIAPTGAVKIRPSARTRRSHSHAHVTATPSMCSAATSAATINAGETPAQISAHYGLSNFQQAGDEGRGETIAVYELEPFSASDIAGYESCVGAHTSVSVETVAGGAGTGPGSGEAATDVEDLIGLAPQASIRVYEGPATGVGAYATYSQIVADDAAQIVSTSWGLCESEEGRTAALAEDTLFQEAAVQGQSVIASSGDDGSDDCGTGAMAVDDPGSQPWVTSVGGTRFAAAGDSVWDDDGGAAGGGVSQFWGRPAWQTAAQAQSLVSCGAAGLSCREVPDISADADPATGYEIFYRGGWHTVGGTSVAAPTIAALAALASASPACGGSRLGFLDPALYADAADIDDVTSGTNAFDGVPGFDAAPGYDMASGLGTPTAALGPALCGDSLSIDIPGDQTWSTAWAVSAASTATSAKGASVSWSATGLPAGTTINAASGTISGKPTQTGTFTVTVTGLDADGATQTGSFDATVVHRATVATAHHAAGTRRTGSAHHRRHRKGGRRRHAARASAARGSRTGHHRAQAPARRRR